MTDDFNHTQLTQLSFNSLQGLGSTAIMTLTDEAQQRPEGFHLLTSSGTRRSTATSGSNSDQIQDTSSLDAMRLV